MQKNFFTNQNFFTSKDSRLFCNTKLHFVLTNRYSNNYANHNNNINKATLNLAYHVNDSPESVKKNRACIMQKYYKNKTLLYLNQIHSNIIFTINENNGILESSKHGFNKNTTKKHESVLISNECDEILIGDGDGIICNKSNFVLMSMVADCNPILIYAKSQNVFAVLHAGRLGLCSKILTHALILFTRDYKVKLKDIYIFIGASIRKCCYEIDRKLALQLIQECGEKYVVHENNKYKFDMIALLLDEINLCGILPSQVEIHESCTCCDEVYFSYRRENITGRFALFASLI